jgi:hypothetical protein
LRVIGEIEERGCEAAGYRLAGEELDRICCRHLYASDRLLTVWPGSDEAVVMLIGPHGGAVGDVYADLLHALGIDVPADERSKPSCCDEEGVPPVDAAAAHAICDALERSTRRGRRRP